MNVLGSGAPQQFGDLVAGQVDYWLVLDVLVIVVVTALLALRDLSATNRPFDWGRIVCTMPFGILVFLQSLMLMTLLIVLTGFGRTTLRYGADALWVALAGVSLLKSLPSGKKEDGERLWSLADWLFKKFYRGLALIIVGESDSFRSGLEHAYLAEPATFLANTISFINATEAAGVAATDQYEVNTRYNALPNDAAKSQYLANWVAPRTTRGEWKQLTKHKIS